MKYIKKFIVSLIVSGLFFSFVMPIQAMKNTSNKASVKHINWNLSGDVMPIPPYGTADIPNSDTDSKLIVNMPNGRTEVAISGIMKGLMKNSDYTIYLSKGYVPYISRTIVGEWKWTVLNTYEHRITITSQDSDGNFYGTGVYPYDGTAQTTETISGQINGNNVTITTVYNGPYNEGYTVTATGVINEDGSLSGSNPWSWKTSPGTVKPASGSTGWPGLFTENIQPFIVKTDTNGEATWHLNMKDEDFSKLGWHSMSVWVNGGGRTILISDTFNVEVN